MLETMRRNLMLWRTAAVGAALTCALTLMVLPWQAAPKVEYVAVLAGESAQANILVTFDPGNKRLTLKRVGSFQEDEDKSLQLWALPASGPQSLGVLGRDAQVRLTALENQIQDVPALAISLEPKGGVPAGQGPSGPILFKGALLKTTL